MLSDKMMRLYIQYSCKLNFISKASIYLYTVIYMRESTLVITCCYNFTHSSHINNWLVKLVYS